MQLEDGGALTATVETRVYACGDGADRASLSITGDLLRVDLVGDALNEGFVGCFREALAEGAIRPNMRVLVDLSSFNGSVDWAAIHAIGALAPWGTGTGRASKVAYVTKSAWIAAMLKLTSVLFPRSQHRQFSGLHNALQWLERD